MLRLACNTGRKQLRRSVLARPLIANADTSPSSTDTERCQSNNLYLGHGVSCFSHSQSGIRNFSSTRISNFAAETPTPPPPGANVTENAVDDTINRLFSGSEGEQSSIEAVTDGLVNGVWEPIWYNFADQAILFVKFLHDFTNVEYGWCIIGATIVMRTAIFPLMVMSQRHTSRMAHIQPELKQMQRRYEALGSPSRQDRLQFSDRTKALFDKYEVKPFRAFVAPAVQLPMFMGFFFGMRKIDTIFPEEMAAGGILWFSDLTVPDPYFILPVLSGGSMLLLMEMSKNEMSANAGASGPMIMNFFRVTSLMMIPFLTTFDASMVCYWTANNMLTMAQTMTLKQQAIRDYFGIWEKPKPIPGVVEVAPSMSEELKKLMKRIQGEPTSDKHRMAQHNRAIETKKKAIKMMRSTKTKGKGKRP
mmetsp:Transcript_13123/g.17174  ORF Transcript_13123/g.17174 Transcript_13123/m.17174 type:complete len:419 (-) Transcript_13123:201-1457(-)